MANIRALATVRLLMTLVPLASIATPPQDIPAEVKSCKAISDDSSGLDALMAYLEDLRRHKSL